MQRIEFKFFSFLCLNVWSFNFVIFKKLDEKEEKKKNEKYLAFLVSYFQIIN